MISHSHFWCNVRKEKYLSILVDNTIDIRGVFQKYVDLCYKINVADLTFTMNTHKLNKYFKFRRKIKEIKWIWFPTISKVSQPGAARRLVTIWRSWRHEYFVKSTRIQWNYRYSLREIITSIQFKVLNITLGK